MPLGEVRRKDRVMSAAESEESLARALVGRIGTVAPTGMPYVTPMNFVYDPDRRTVFLHCAATGHMLDNLAYNPLACFEVDEPGEVLATGRYACNASQVYKSVICFGRAGLVSNQQEKERVLNLLAHKYLPGPAAERPFDPVLAEVATTTVIALRVEVMTGKQRRQP